MAEKCMRFCGAVLLGLVILQLSPSHGSSGGSNSLASGGASADTDSSGGGDGDGSSDASSRRRAQVDVPDPPVCAQSLERGEGSMLCGTSAGRELCTSACLIVDSLQPVPPPPVPPPDPVLGVAVCDQVLARGVCSSFLDACPDVCTAPGSAADPTQGGNRVDGMSCLVLLQLEGGCAHDLSLEDTALQPGTRVSDLCPDACSGHGKCAVSALDVSFLGSTDDSSGFGATVELEGGACVDGGGVTFDGDGRAVITPGEQYATGAGFTLAFWMLPAVEEVWEPYVDFRHGARILYDHLPRRPSSVAGGISMSLNRRAWLGAWFMQVLIGGAVADYELNILRDAIPKWTHIAVVVELTQIEVWEDGVQIRDTKGRLVVPRKYHGELDLADELHLGGPAISDVTYGWPAVPSPPFRGSIAMLQLYAAVASAQLDVWCVFGGGMELVQNQRMAQETPSACRGRISTGCTSSNAVGFDGALSTYAMADDGSCEFPHHQAMESEHGVIHVTDEWQRVDISGSYHNPVVLCGVVTRDSTTEAVVRVRNVVQDATSGSRYFEVAAEQKSCHSANPPPTSERVDYIVVEAGVSTEGWHAGLTRVRDAQWHRISFLQEIDDNAHPVVISQVQTYDNRTQFVSTRHYFPPVPTPHHWNFVGVDLEMEWPAAREYCRAHYHDLASIHSAAENALATAVCETTRNHFHSDAQSHYCYIGLNDERTENTFVWTDGSANDFLPVGMKPYDDFAGAEDWVVILDRDMPQYDYRAGDWNDIGPDNGWRDFDLGDYSTGFICERQPPGLETGNRTEPERRNLAFFLTLQGEGIWCQNDEYFAEYFDNLELSGTPLATQCEIDAPAWHWHSASLGGDGVPPILVGKTRLLAPQLFSARWTARVGFHLDGECVFSSHANQGSRVIVDDATVLDRFEEGGSTFSSEPVWLGVGVHTIVYEYRSGLVDDYTPTNSYAELSWTTRGVTFGAVASGSNGTNATKTADELYADVGWLVCSPGGGRLHATSFLSGLTCADASLVTTIGFGSAFSTTPRIFAAVVSDAHLSSHLRLTAASVEQAAIAVEYVLR